MRRELLKESLVLGLAGVLAGVPLGIGLGHLFLPFVAKTAALNYQLVAPETALSLSPLSLALAAALGLASAVMAAALPAWRVARVSVTQLLRGRGVEPEGMAAGLGWPVRILIAAAIIAGLALQSASRWPVWGLITTALLAVGTALAARPLLRLTSRLVLGRLGEWVDPTHRFATADLAYNERRSALTIAMLSLGMGSVLWLWIVGGSFEESVRRLPAFSSDLVVASAHVAGGFLEAPLDQSVLAETRQVPGVGAAASERVVEWRIDIGDTTLPVALDAFDAAYFLTPALGRWPLLEQRIDDPWPAVARGEAVVLSSNLMLKLGDEIHDTITLQSPRGPVTFRVAGVTNSFISPDGAIILTREQLATHWEDRRINRVFVNAQAGADVASVRRGIEQALGRKHHLQIITSADLGEYWAEQAQRAFQPIDLLAVVVFLVVLFGVADTLVAGLIERTRDIGVLRAVGMPRGVVARIIRVEAVYLGGMGLALALVTGLILGLLWVRATFPYLLGWLLNLHLPWMSIGLVSGLTLAVCLLASILPARWAAALRPADALRQE